MFSWTAFCGWRGGWPFPSTAFCWWRASSALISEWPFDWAFFSGVYWGHQNVYFTLLLGLLAMKALDTHQTPEGMPALKGILGAAACFLAAALLHCDYDVLGLALILALYLTRKDRAA